MSRCFDYTIHIYTVRNICTIQLTTNITMYVLAIVQLFICVSSCVCMNSWEVPEGNLWKHTNHDLDVDWLEFKFKHSKAYTDDKEEYVRRLYWEDTLRYIEDHNNRYKAGKETYIVGENHLSDLADDEFRQIYLTGLIPPENKVYPEGLSEPDPEVPSSVDWRGNLTTRVKNQGDCGACWAFSAVGALEGQLLKKNKGLRDGSEQNLIDCATYKEGYSNIGCDGGWMTFSFEYIKTFGFNSERCYPYEAREGSCRYMSTCNIGYDSGFNDVGQTEYSLQSKVAKVGPISVAVLAIGTGFRSYKSEIYNDHNCYEHKGIANRAMVAVGYGSTGGRDYWIIKNSWGSWWGNNGYVYMTRNQDNQCSVASFASYPTI